MDTGLRNRVALIAASSHGIGRATAEAFAAEGCRLAMCSRDENAISDAAGSIARQHGIETYSRAVDVTDAAAVSRFVNGVADRFGTIDICVTNAGGPPAKIFLETTIDEWQKAFETNLLSVVIFAQAVIPHMQRKQWGRFITITSMTVRQPVQDLVLSNAIRVGVSGLLKSLSNEFGKDGILFNNVGPGFTATDRLKDLAAVQAKSAGVSEADIFSRWAEQSPLKRVGEPREIADAIVWLASERASFVTGQTLVVDGGYYRGL
jgi:3-oxoacyl-[acyl-carrier protein] reductase